MAASDVFKEAEYKLKENPPIFLGTIQQSIDQEMELLRRRLGNGLMLLII